MQSEQRLTDFYVINRNERNNVSLILNIRNLVLYDS